MIRPRILGLYLTAWLGLITAPAAAQSFDGHIAEAAQRFGVPAHWIRAVMRVESAGDPWATSSAGAIGLMQVMPATYAELRSRQGLGPDPYEPRDNILAGAAYLRQMHDRFGPAGMLAAYNAGPGRYATHLATGRPLPAETRRYVTRLAPILGDGSSGPVPVPAPPDWRTAGLFAARQENAPTEPLLAQPNRSSSRSDLFVRRVNPGESQ